MGFLSKEGRAFSRKREKGLVLCVRRHALLCGQKVGGRVVLEEGGRGEVEQIDGFIEDDFLRFSRSPSSFASSLQNSSKGNKDRRPSADGEREGVCERERGASLELNAQTRHYSPSLFSYSTSLSPLFFSFGAFLKWWQNVSGSCQPPGLLLKNCSLSLPLLSSSCLPSGTLQKVLAVLSHGAPLTYLSLEKSNPFRVASSAGGEKQNRLQQQTRERTSLSLLSLLSPLSSLFSLLSLSLLSSSS